jgi:glucose/mannose transport system substrate-binding protein
MAEVTGRSTTPTLDILQHWGAEGVAPLDAVIEAFERHTPNVDVSQRIVPIAKLRLTAKSEVLRGNPPDLWVEWPGKNLKPTVDAGVVADVTDLWEETGLVDTYVSGARTAARFDGSYRCIPTDMYRINNLFYNVGHLERAGVDVDRIQGPDEFVEVLPTIADATDAHPITLSAREPFGILQLWETLLIAYGGESTYDDLLDGHVSRHRDVVERSVATLARILDFAPGDMAFTSVAESDGRFARSAAAMTHNGGWAVGRLKRETGFEFGTDWEYTPFPGTEDAYQLNMNAIVPSEQTEGDETVRSFLRHLSSAEQLAHINDHLGAVPPHGDVDVRDFHPVIQRHHRALESTAYDAPSMAHGLGVAPETVSELKAAIVPLVSERDVDATTAELMDALR